MTSSYKLQNDLEKYPAHVEISGLENIQGSQIMLRLNLHFVE